MTEETDDLILGLLVVGCLQPILTWILHTARRRDGYSHWDPTRNSICSKGESECLFPEDLQRREGASVAFGAHFGAERGHNTMGYSMPNCIKQ